MSAVHKYPIGTIVWMKEFPEGAIPRQRAEILEHEDGGFYMLCILPEDRMADDHDGLVEGVEDDDIEGESS